MAEKTASNESGESDRERLKQQFEESGTVDIDISPEEIRERTAERQGEDEPDMSEIIESHAVYRLFPCINTKLLVYLNLTAYDVSASEISEQAGVARRSWYNHRDDLIELGLVEQTRTSGQSQMYDITEKGRALLVDLLDRLA